MGLQYAFPGLMPHRPVNFETRIIADENGEIQLLLHTGKADDAVYYCIMLGGNRRIGYIKDPAYKPAHGLDHYPHDKEFEAPYFLYTTTAMPDNVKIPKINIHGCPVPVDELCQADNPTHFVLKLPITGLPIGDTVVEVSINGKRRNYIVTRPDFHIHRKHGHNLAKRYIKLLELGEDMFSVTASSNASITIDVHTNVEKKPDVEYKAVMLNESIEYEIDYTWRDTGWITLNTPEDTEPGKYAIRLYYNEEEPKIIVNGSIVITESTEI